jgi:DNA repair exonuclease SbcCD ATPase subunit
MFKSAISSLFAVFLFAMGAAGAWYFVQYQQQQQKLQSEAEIEAHALPRSLTAVDSGGAPLNEALPPGGPGTRQTMPLPVHGRTMSPEEIVRYGFMYRNNIEEIKKQKQQVEQEQSRLQLVQKDLEQQKMEAEGILKQVQHNVDRGEQLLAQIQEERQHLAEEREQHKKELEQIQSATQVPESIQRENVIRTARLLGGMEAEEAAKLIKELANKGNMDYALQILDNVEERNASKILDALDDISLLAQITEAYRELKREQSATTRR